jgi:hypothetical protein
MTYEDFEAENPWYGGKELCDKCNLLQGSLMNA